MILAVGVWAYANSFAGVFVLDDVRAIVRNPTIRGEAPLSTALAPPTGTTVAGRPLANLSFALNYALAPPQAREVFEPSRGGRDDARTALFLRQRAGVSRPQSGASISAPRCCCSASCAARC